MFLNLKTKEGRDIVKELVKEYDIVMEQFRPGVMDRLGLGYEDLKAVKPQRLSTARLQATDRQVRFVMPQVTISTICQEAA